MKKQERIWRVTYEIKGQWKSDFVATGDSAIYAVAPNSEGNGFGLAPYRIPAGATIEDVTPPPPFVPGWYRETIKNPAYLYAIRSHNLPAIDLWYVSRAGLLHPKLVFHGRETLEHFAANYVRVKYADDE